MELEVINKNESKMIEEGIKRELINIFGKDNVDDHSEALSTLGNPDIVVKAEDKSQIIDFRHYNLKYSLWDL